MNKRSNSMYFLLILAGSFAGGVVGSYLWSGQSVAMAAAKHAKIVKAEKFVLVDAKGEQRALLDVASTGTAFLALYDPQGMDRVDLRVNPDGAQAWLFTMRAGSGGLLRVRTRLARPASASFPAMENNSPASPRRLMVM